VVVGEGEVGDLAVDGFGDLAGHDLLEVFVGGNWTEERERGEERKGSEEEKSYKRKTKDDQM
jgi:hypothetical protein